MNPLALAHPNAFDVERNSTDADLARDAVDDPRSAARGFADAWKVAQRAINDAMKAGYIWTGDGAHDAYVAMQDASEACGLYADAIEADITTADRLVA